MKLKLRSWTARTLVAVSTLVAASTAPTVYAQAPAAADAGVLTEDMVVRVLGMEKGALTAKPEDTDEKKGNILKVRTAFTNAIAAFQQGKLADAEKELKGARDLDKGLAPADVYLARLCFAVNNEQFVRTGRQFLDRAVANNPDAPEAYAMLGNLALLEGRLADAHLLFANAAILTTPYEEGKTWSPEQLLTFKKNCFAGKVSVYEQRADWKNALSEVKAWLALDPSDAVATFRKGRIEFMSKLGAATDAASITAALPGAITAARPDFESAYKLAGDAVAADKKDKELLPVPPAELALLELLTQSNNVKEARAEIPNIVAKMSEYSKNPKEGSRVNSTLAQWYLAQGEFDEAKNFVQAAMKQDDKSPALEQLFALLKYYSGPIEDAKTAFTKLNQDNPEDAFAANYLALTLIESSDENDRNKAVRVAELAAKLNQKSAVALSTLGWVYFKMNRVQEAAQIFVALNQQQNLQISPDMAYYMAKVFGKIPQGGIEKGLELLGRVVTATGPFKHRQDAIEQFKNWGGTMPAVTPPAANTTIGSTPVATPPAAPKASPTASATPPATTTPPSDGGNN